MSEALEEVAFHLLSVIDEDTCTGVSESIALTVSVVFVINPRAFVAVITVIARPNSFAMRLAILHLTGVGTVGAEAELSMHDFELFLVYSKENSVRERSPGEAITNLNQVLVSILVELPELV